MARFIVNLITWAIFMLSMGTLAQITAETIGFAAKASRTGLISLKKVNDGLTQSSTSGRR